MSKWTMNKGYGPKPEGPKATGRVTKIIGREGETIHEMPKKYQSNRLTVPKLQQKATMKGRMGSR